jgi:hypothetical protein
MLLRVDHGALLLARRELPNRRFLVVDPNDGVEM